MKFWILEITEEKIEKFHNFESSVLKKNSKSQTFIRHWGALDVGMVFFLAGDLLIYKYVIHDLRFFMSYFFNQTLKKIHEESEIIYQTSGLLIRRVNVSILKPSLSAMPWTLFSWC